MSLIFLVILEPVSQSFFPRLRIKLCVLPVVVRASLTERGLPSTCNTSETLSNFLPSLLKHGAFARSFLFYDSVLPDTVHHLFSGKSPVSSFVPLSRC